MIDIYEKDFNEILKLLILSKLLLFAFPSYSLSINDNDEFISSIYILMYKYYLLKIINYFIYFFYYSK